jgi:hypothetical protein
MTPIPRILLLTCVVTAPAVAQAGWTQLAPPLSPSPRGDYGIAFDWGRATTVLFGGWIGAPLGDTWEWNGSSWTLLATAAAPPARTGHAMAYDLLRDEIVLFGGTRGSGFDLADTWVFANGSWSARSPAVSPGTRVGSRLALDPTSGCMLLFGGATGFIYLDDTWSWDGATWAPRTLTVHPSLRYSPAMAMDLQRGRIVLFGGFFGWTVLQDTWIWDGNGWSQLTTSVGPPRLRYPSLSPDLRNGAMVLFGGNVAGLPPAPSATWVLVDNVWRCDPRPMPPTRDGAFVSTDVSRSRMVLFGGQSGNSFMGDTWEYDVGVLASWTPYGAGCAGSAGMPVLRARAGSLPVLGSAFALELANVPGPLTAFVLGTSDQQWNGQPLPLDLSSVGMPGCRLLASADATLFAVTAAGGATCTLSIPSATAFAGLRFFAQGFALDPSANALGVVASDAGAGVLGPF